VNDAGVPTPHGDDRLTRRVLPVVNISISQVGFFSRPSARPWRRGCSQSTTSAAPAEVRDLALKAMVEGGWSELRQVTRRLDKPK